ncbi:MAG: hypothetical protein JSS79_19700 [Bacteroidetes bacterium]|nr:hypothetical protein [Bacteroidota bacterium]
MNIVRFLFNLFRIDKTNWKAVSLCVVTAVVFWIFNAFNKNYSTNVRFPLLFEFDGEKYLPAEHLPKSINLNVSGNGWDLFRKHMGLKVPTLIIPLEHPTEVKKIVGSTLLPIVATQLGNLKVNFVVTDTLTIKIDPRDFHRYKLAADVSGVKFSEGYGRISPVVVLPDSVRLEGPQSWLHALGDSIFLKVQEDKVSENFRDEVEVSFPGSEFVKRNPPIAQVMFEVGQVTQVTKRVKVTTDKKTSVVFTDSVEAQFQIPVNRASDFNTLSREMVSQVSVRQLKQSNSIVPKVLNIPSYALLLRVDSVYKKPR